MRAAYFFLIAGCFWVAFETLCLPTSAQSGNAVRTWTDDTGRQVRASLEGFKDEETVILLLENGSSVPFPIAKLSQPDQDYATEMRSANPQPSKVDWENPKQSDDFSIRGVRRENSPGFVSTEAGWEYRIKCIEARVEYKGREPRAKAEVRAYFYDREGRLLQKFDDPPRRQNEDRTYIDAPEFFEKGETVEFYYPLTEFLEESDWATVLITFGSGNTFSAETMPTTSLENLAFAEKKLLFPDWEPESKPATPAGGQAMANVDLEIRRMKVEEYPYSVVFDGDYRRNRDCVTAEVRADGEIRPGDGDVKMHVFDHLGKFVETRRRPSSAQLDNSGTYVNVPKIADNSWHPVVFALDKELERNEYPTFVLVFQFGGATVASIESSVGATIEKLSFPEKENLKK